MTFSNVYVTLIQALVARAPTTVQLRHGVKGCPPELRDEFAKEIETDSGYLAKVALRPRPHREC